MQHKWKLVSAFVLTLVMAPGALLAQCPTGECPNAGGGGVRRVDSPPAGNAAGGGSVAVRVDPARLPEWQPIDESTIDTAAQEKRPIVVYFPIQNEAEGAFSGEDLADMSRSKAVFIKVPFTDNREAAPDGGTSILPSSKLLSDNPRRDFNVAVGKATLIVCDWYGNEVSRLTTGIKAAEIDRELSRVAARVDSTSKKLQKGYDSAKAAWDKQDRVAAVKAIIGNFKEGVVGLEAQQDTIKLYSEIMDASRATVAELSEKGDKAGLKRLSRELRNTEAGKAAEEALKTLG